MPGSNRAKGGAGRSGRSAELPGFIWFDADMSSLKTAMGVAALMMASILLASAAAAETVVPPGNSAATQYTEAFPTAGGNAVNKNDGIEGGGRNSSPADVLGDGN